MVKCLLHVFEACAQFLIYAQSLFWYSQHPVACLVSFPLLNPNWSAPSTSSISLPILFLSILATIFAVCAMRLIMWSSLHFVAFAFYFKAVIVTEWNPWATVQFHVCCWSVMPIFWDYPLPVLWVYPQVHHHLQYSSYASSPLLLLTFPLQNVRACLVCVYFLSHSTSKFSGRLGRSYSSVI